MIKLYNKIKAFLGNLFDKVFNFIYKPLFPESDKKRYLILLIFTLTLITVYSIFYHFKIKDVLPYEVKGKISKLAVRSSSGAGRTSGRSTRYYFRVEGYRATFTINDSPVIGSVNDDIFEVGNYIEIGIDKKDKSKLQTEDDSYKARIEPIGIKFNGVEEVKIYQSIFEYLYTKYLYISIPIFFYYFGSVIFIAGDLFTYNRRRKEKKLANK